MARSRRDPWARTALRRRPCSWAVRVFGVVNFGYMRPPLAGPHVPSGEEAFKLNSRLSERRSVDAVGDSPPRAGAEIRVVWVAPGQKYPPSAARGCRNAARLGRLGAFMWHFSPLRGGLCRVRPGRRSWVIPRSVAY